MLIKEYRICLPMTVDEYRIAQLYMIQKKSQEESTGQGSGVEIIRNEPYTDGPGGKGGQYTFKIYHIGSHLPGWFRNILPKSALVVEEEAWNAYPYTKTRYKVPIIEKFTIEIETCYHNDAGTQDNVFNLGEEDRRRRIIDYMDIVADPISSGDYRLEEDPSTYRSSVTGRGPLVLDWRTMATAQGGGPVMCAYKLCKIEFKYWGMQTKIENFIDDIGLRKTMLRAHRQAWCWQDEWSGLTIEDIRRLEAQAQLVLAEKMRLAAEADGATTIGSCSVPLSTSASQMISPTANATTTDSTSLNRATAKGIEAIQRRDSPNLLESDEFERLSHHNEDEDDEDENEDDDCFTDAKSDFPSDTDSFMTCKNTFASNATLNIDPGTGQLLSTAAPHTKKYALVLVVHGGSLLDTSHEYHNKNSDVGTLRQTLDLVMQSICPGLRDRVAVRLVACPSSVAGIVTSLTKLSPQMSMETGASAASTQQHYVPLAAIPMLLVQSAAYKPLLETVRQSINDRYNEFLRTEGFMFDGQISIVADSLGSLFVYDLLSQFPEGPETSAPPSTGTMNDSFTSSSSGTTSNKQASRKTSACSSILSSESDRPLDFQIQNFFMLGTPLGLVLAQRYGCDFADHSGARLSRQGSSDTLIAEDDQQLPRAMRKLRLPANPTVKQHCNQVYNIFHFSDPSAYRVEPLIVPQFRNEPPLAVQRFSHINYGGCGQFQQDGVEEGCQANYLIETLFGNPRLLLLPHGHSNPSPGHAAETSNLGKFLARESVKTVMSQWWGDKRVDCGLHCPEGVHQFPLAALPHLLHASYWESRDCAAFVVRQILDSLLQASRGDDLSMDLLLDFSTIGNTPHPQAPLLTVARHGRHGSKASFKFKNVAANHRANDVLVLSGQTQVLTARFMYGTFDMVTPKNEKVDVYIMNQHASLGHWEKEGTEVTDNAGRVQFHVPESRRLAEGIYPVRMVLKSDSSAVDFHLAVLPPNVEVVVFSIDGSFAASVSLSGKDPKIRAGCIDVARFWQERGYLLLYVSARPSLQQRSVQRWLAQHKFPLGMLLFASSVSRDPLRQKMLALSRLVQDVQMRIHCAYGSAKDISTYKYLGLHSNQIFTIGRLTRTQKHNTLSIKSGYASHLSELQRKEHPLSRPVRGLSGVTLGRSAFQLPVRYVNVDDGAGLYRPKGNSDSSNSSPSSTLAANEPSSTVI